MACPPHSHHFTPATAFASFAMRSAAALKRLRAPVGELIAAAMESTGGGTLEEVERDYILRVFRETGGVVSTTATRLGMPRTTLNAMMTKLGISRSDL